MRQNKKLSHINKEGLPGMVDVSHKSSNLRIASASGKIITGSQIMDQLRKEDFHTKKGSIIQTAIIAGTMAVKKTSDFIPLCHPLPLTAIKLNIQPEEDAFSIECTVKTQGQTGVEMEALHGVTAAALTIYDMCKALTHEMKISDIVLEKKTGGKHDYERRSP